MTVQAQLTPSRRWFKIILNSSVIAIGLFAISAGVYTNVYEILKSFGFITSS